MFALYENFSCAFPAVSDVAGASGSTVSVPLLKVGAENAMSKLVDAILKKRFTLTRNIENQVIKINSGWVFDEFDELFVRYFYQPFFDDVLKQFGSPKSKWVILGNPGIGKSAFGLFLLFRAIEAKRTVVYVRKFASRNLLFHSGRTYEFAHGALPDLVVQLLSDKSTVYISDSVSPDKVNAFTVLITSPDRNVWYEWCKQAKALRVLFPVWDLDELIALNRAIIKKPLSDDEVRSRFGVCGGIARSIFNVDLTEEALAEELENSLGLMNLSSNLLDRKYFNLESAALKPHRLFALVPAGAIVETLSPSDLAFYKYFSVDFLSRVAEETVVSAVEQDQKHFWSKFLDGSSGIPLLAVVRGRILERRALPVLAAGITLPCRRLQSDGNGSEDTITFPPSKIDSFEDAEDLKIKFAVDRTKLYNATSSNECAVDCVLPSGLCGNFTVGVSHDIVVVPKRNAENRGLQAVSRALGILPHRGKRTSPVQFYFLVPHDVYPQWTKPQPLLVQGRAAVRVTPQVEQYVVRLPEFSDILKNKRRRRR